jgi:hypothetical protein
MLAEQPIRYRHAEHFSAIYNGRGEFYSDIRPDCRVILTVTTQTYTGSDDKVHAGVFMSIQNANDPGAHLSVYDLKKLSDIRALPVS